MRAVQAETRLAAFSPQSTTNSHVSLAPARPATTEFYGAKVPSAAAAIARSAAL